MKKKDNNKIRVNLKKLIEVFDEHNEIYKGHTTSIIGLIGEDLNTAIFCDYLTKRKKGKNVKILPYPVNTRGVHAGGPELDRWIKVDNILYQTEIKSWCCFKIDGYKLLLEAIKQDIKELTEEKWEKELNGQFNSIKNIENLGKKGVGKVLVKMKIPNEIKKYNKVKPLVVHWMPISNKGIKPFFSYPVKNLGMGKKLTEQIQKYFTKISYFSCSLYIRELIKKGKTKLDLNLPNVDFRMNTINKLLN